MGLTRPALSQIFVSLCQTNCERFDSSLENSSFSQMDLETVLQESDVGSRAEVRWLDLSYNKLDSIVTTEKVKDPTILVSLRLQTKE